jgi:membrane peptidoglycan carboxypeptidase
VSKYFDTTAKQLFGEGSVLPLELYKKVKEWIIAIRLKAIYQNEILAMYCNVYDLGTIL